MEKTLVTELRNEHQRIGKQIKLLLNKDESNCNLLNQYEELEETIAETATVKKTVKAKSKKQPKAKALESSSGLPKFSQVLKNIFESHPQLYYTSKELAAMMSEEIEAGRCNPSKKDMTSAVSAYIWNFSQRGLVKKSGKGYIWAGGKIVFKKQDKIEVPDDLDVLDEAIIEIVKRTDGITQDAVIHDVRISSHYGEIAKNLNGSLASEIDKRLAHLNVKDIVLSKDNKLSINPKADV